MKRVRHAAFTLVELLMAAGASTILGGIIYTVASEGLYSFARNASVNRAYTEARSSIDQITTHMQSAGYTPTLLDATGAVATSPTAPAPGVRFYRYGSLPVYDIPSGTTAQSSLVIKYSGYQSPGVGKSPILEGDLVTIPLLGFQATVATTTLSASNSDGSGQVTLTFYNPPANPYPLYPAAAGTIAAYCSPTLPVDINGKPLVTSFTYQSTTTNLTTGAVTTNTSKTPMPTYYTALVFRQVAYIAVPSYDQYNNLLGAQLRYYPRAMSSVSSPTGTACGGAPDLNGATFFNNASNYSVIANLYTGIVNLPAPNPDPNPLLPFQILVTPSTVTGTGTTATTNNAAASTTLGMTVCENGPDYSNRNLGVANTFSLMRSSAGSRCPLLLHTTNASF